MVAPVDTIFDAAEQVWQDLTSSHIASGFILAYQIAKMKTKVTMSFSQEAPIMPT
jgi:hypothetical protein